MLKVFLTILMIGLVMYCIVKKFHAMSIIFAISIVSLIAYSFITGTSVLGDSSTGNLFLDVFELLANTTKTQLANNVLIGMMFMGYIKFMDYLEASDLFAVYIGKVLVHVKQKYVLMALLTIVCAVLKLFLGGALVVVMLLLSILYPALRSLGCTNATIVSSLVVGTAITWGPTDSGVVATPGMAGIECDVTTFFLDYELLPCIITLVVIAVVGAFCSYMFDKADAKKGIVEEDADSTALKDISQISCPKYYAILPLLPLIFVILFSGKVIPTTMTTVGAVLLAVAVALVVHVLSNLKNFKSAFNGITSFYKGMGDAVGNFVFIIIAGTLFSTTINKVGGMTAIINWMQNLGGSVYLMATIGGILAFVVTALTVSYLANLNIFVPFFATISQVTGYSGLRLAAIANSACGLGTGLAAASNTMLFLTGMCKTDMVTILKRNAIPLLSGLVALLVSSFIIG